MERTDGVEARLSVWALLPGETVPTHCGELWQRADGVGRQSTCFRYGASFLSTWGAFAVDPFALPLEDRAYRNADPVNAMHGALWDAGPDDWGRYVIDRQFGAQTYPIGYLLRSQEDRVGHLCFSESPDRSPALSAPLAREWLSEAWQVVTGLEAGRPVAPELAHRIRANTAMGGARPKLTVADGQAQWLAKFPSRRDDPRYSQARVEAAMLDLAAQCGLNAARAELHTIADGPAGPGGDILLVRRFDRSVAGDGGWYRDAYVSARTVLSSDRSSLSFSGSYARLARALTRWSAKPASDKIELFRRMVFNCCVSNTDDHDRNHGLLANEEADLFRLSPAFDIVPRLHQTQRRYQAMNIGDQGAEASVENLLTSAIAFDLDVARAAQIIRDMQATVQAGWRSALQGRGVDRMAIELLSPCFRELPQSFDGGTERR